MSGAGDREETRRSCPSCGAELAGGGSGPCPECLLRVGLTGAGQSSGTGEVEIEGYQVLDRLGEGGMGVVYLAEQLRPVRRMVAVKVVKLGMDTEALIRRFDGERQALALMGHPNIAQVLDAGATTSGRPFFAMEWVDGVPLDDYCDREGVGIEGRVKFLIDAASAVQHAHSKGVAHCDLKPSNLLVAENEDGPVLKVIDFGIARAVDPEAKFGATLADGGGTKMVGTPAYMAPEQADGSSGDVDTLADVYSLGAVLYELLAGDPPFSDDQLTSGGLVEMLRVLREEDPPPVTTRAEASGRKVPDDLSWIVVRAMEKERERRYGGAGQLADDLRRFLAGEAVEARPPSRGYLLAKFARRHRAVLSIAAAVVLMLTGAMVFSIVQAVRAARAEKEAVADRERSEKLVTYMLEDLYGTLKDLGRLDLLAGVSDQAAAYYESVPPDSREESALGRSSSLAKIAEVEEALGRSQKALAAAQGSLELIEPYATAPGADDLLRFEFAIRSAQAGRALRRLEGAKAAMPYFDTAIETVQPLVARGGEMQPNYESYLASFYNMRGTSWVQMGDPEKGLEVLAEARRLREKLLATLPETDVSRPDDLAKILSDIARVKAGLGEREEATELLEQALALRVTIPDRRPGELVWRTKVAFTHFDIARHHRRGGDFEIALGSIGEGVKIWVDLCELEPGNMDWKSHLARAVTEQVAIAIEAEKRQEFEEAAGWALELWNEITSLEPDQTERVELLRAHLHQGQIKEAIGDPAMARERFQSVIDLATAMMDADEPMPPRIARQVESFVVTGQKHLDALGGASTSR